MDNATPASHALSADTLYFCDNGACYCGAHAGATARHTGRDLSGQETMEITPDVLAEWLDYGNPAPRCERPGCHVRAPELYR